MSKNLVIVESPAKAKTINKYLGDDYTVMASIGHIKDLPAKDLGVDVENDFEPTYEVIPDTKKRNNKKIVSDLKKAAKLSEAILPRGRPRPRRRGDLPAFGGRDRSKETCKTSFSRDVQRDHQERDPGCV